MATCPPSVGSVGVEEESSPVGRVERVVERFLPVLPPWPPPLTVVPETLVFLGLVKAFDVLE